MKRFIVTIPLQVAKKVKYAAGDPNETLLANDMETAFPMLIPISNSVTEGEQINVIVITTENSNVMDENVKALDEELKFLGKEKNFTYTVTEIKVSSEENNDKHLGLFRDIISIFKDNDEVYADITYGQKPTPMVLLMALNYAYEMCGNTDVKAIIYGQVTRARTNDGTMEITSASIYDVSPLFHMNSIVNKMASVKPKDPLKFIEAIMDM